MEVEQEIKDAVGEYKQGNKDEARKIIRDFIKSNPTNEVGWMIFAKITDNDGERIRCLERVIDINPNNQEATEKLKSLKKTEEMEEPFSSPSIRKEESNIQKTVGSKICPFCKKDIEVDAKICGFCGRQLYEIGGKVSMIRWEYMRCLYYTEQEVVKTGIMSTEEKTHYYIKIGEGKDTKKYKDDDADLRLDELGSEGWELVSTTPIVGPKSKYSGAGGVAVALTAGPLAHTSETSTTGIILWFKRRID